MRVAIVIAAAAFLAGCGGQRMPVADQCSQYGSSPGTTAHANCQMRMGMARQSRQDQAWDDVGRYGQQLMAQPSSPRGGTTTYTMPSGRVMSCTRIGDMVSCL